MTPEKDQTIACKVKGEDLKSIDEKIKKLGLSTRSLYLQELIRRDLVNPLNDSAPPPGGPRTHQEEEDTPVPEEPGPQQNERTPKLSILEHVHKTWKSFVAAHASVLWWFAEAWREGREKGGGK